MRHAIPALRIFIMLIILLVENSQKSIGWQVKVICLSAKPIMKLNILIGK